MKRNTADIVKYVAQIALPIVLALVSLFALCPKYSSADSYRDTIAVLDQEKENVVQLTGASTAAAAAITLLPGDVCTPIAEKLMDLTKDFTIVLCAIYFEKYMLTVVGYFVFQWLVPLSCLGYLLSVLLRLGWLRDLAVRVFIFGLCVFLMIPTSVKISSLINTAYEDSIQATIDTAEDSAQQIQDAQDQEEQQEEEPQQEKNVFERLFDTAEQSVSAITQDIGQVTARLKKMVDSYLDALAVMIVTSCVIPMVVIAAFLYLAKSLMGIKLKTPELWGEKEEQAGES